MLGFVVEDTNISRNVTQINSLLPNKYINQQRKTVCAYATQQLTYTDFASGYQYSYISKHKRSSKHEITLYHLMFDFSNNIV
jgi:hypothetical protein